MYCGIILASGFSSRLGEDKLLLNFKGIPLLEHVLIAASRASLDEIILVYRKNRVKRLGEKYGCKVIHNSRADQGQSEAVKAGLKAASAPCAGYLFMVSDQPFLNETIIDKIINKHKETRAKIVMPLYGMSIESSIRGTPTLFSAELKSEILSVKGDKGGREIIEKYETSAVKILINYPQAAVDLDTWEDFNRWQDC